MVLIKLDVLSRDVPIHECLCENTPALPSLWSLQVNALDASSFWHRWTGLDMGPFQVYSSSLSPSRLGS